MSGQPTLENSDEPEREPSMRRAANQLALTILVLIAASPVIAQEVSIYPTEGQTLQQQEIDRLECNDRAGRETGFDPAHPSASPSPSVANLAQWQRGMRAAGPRSVGVLAGDAAAGAGVPVGRLPSVLFGTRRGDDLQRQQQALAQQAATEIDDQSASYQQAMSNCLGVRGYIVR
jgi:hypothetical protein